jgi:murein DD-endopeptidase MepM/ murein hydrolase activator NlpD
VTLCATAVALALLLFANPSEGQILDDGGSTTTTAPSSSTTQPGSTTTTAGLLTPSTSTTTTTAPDAGQPDDGSAPPEGGAPTDGGDGGGTEPITWGTVPPEAQRIIDSVERTPANGSADLLEAVEQLVDLGLSRDEAIRVGFGRFPVAGLAKYSHDWLYPRYGPGFRFHMGTDVFADFGTPLRSPVDGIVRSSTSDLGGLSTKIYMDDGTYFYYAHLSALVDGFEEGMKVQTGDIVGYVGDSGNAKGGAPHLHLGIYPKGGEATDPKPILDRFLAEAMAQLPSVIEQVRANRAVSPGASTAAVPGGRTTPRSLLATSLLRPLTQRSAAGQMPTEILYQASANPSAGGVSVARGEAEELAESIDWQAWESRAVTREQLLRRTEEVVRLALGPLAGSGRRDGSAVASSP